jgi:hypothetical protein
VFGFTDVLLLLLLLLLLFFLAVCLELSVQVGRCICIEIVIYTDIMSMNRSVEELLVETMERWDLSKFLLLFFNCYSSSFPKL